MNEAQVDAVWEAARDGISFDGLAVEPSGDAVDVTVREETAESVPEADLASVLDEHAPYVSNWYFWHAVVPQREDRWSFLRWLEGAEERSVPERYDALESGVERTWGQLQIAVSLGEDGERRYALRNVEDAGESAESLTAYEDPLEARALARHDDDERYRPLKTAPTLRTGWTFPDLSAQELVSAVDFFYPATVANWHREREGELDVSHWRETMERQTGIYGVIQTWDRGEGHEHVEWVAEACCDDSQCLKRREWQYDEDTELEADGGDGAFPCREPCSLVVSAARKWTKLEAEEPKTYELELTPSEREQIEAVLDAVADGEADQIREADVYDDANRWRARYLRAKLFDEDGQLPMREVEERSESDASAVGEE